jgi:hypothetical protein
MGAPERVEKSAATDDHLARNKQAVRPRRALISIKQRQHPFRDTQIR